MKKEISDSEKVSKPSSISSVGIQHENEMQELEDVKAQLTEPKLSQVDFDEEFLPVDHKHPEPEPDQQEEMRSDQPGQRVLPEC